VLELRIIGFNVPCKITHESNKKRAFLVNFIRYEGTLKCLFKISLQQNSFFLLLQFFRLFAHEVWWNNDGAIKVNIKFSMRGMVKWINGILIYWYNTYYTQCESVNEKSTSLIVCHTWSTNWHKFLHHSRSLALAWF
jgi:hypothetical protein